MMKNTRIELGTEALEPVNGGFDFFAPVKKALKDVGNWSYKNVIKPIGDGTRDYVVKPTFDCLGCPIDDSDNGNGVTAPALEVH